MNWRVMITANSKCRGNSFFWIIFIIFFGHSFSLISILWLPFSNDYSTNQRSASKWHAVCYMSTTKPTKSVLNENCKKAGEDDADPENILYQLIDLEQERGVSAESANVIATNIEFSNIQLNKNFNLTMLNPRRKTSTQHADCRYLLEFNCASI